MCQHRHSPLICVCGRECLWSILVGSCWGRVCPRSFTGKAQGVVKVKAGESESRLVVSDSLRPHGQYSPGNAPGQNTGVCSCSLLQGTFPTQGSNPGIKPRSPTLQADSLPAEPSGKPKAGKVEAFDGIRTGGRQWDTALVIKQACHHGQIQKASDRNSTRQGGLRRGASYPEALQPVGHWG